MTAYRRPLARLPLDVFEPLVAPAPCGLGSTGGRDDDAPDPPPSGEPRQPSSASEIRARICRRLLGGGDCETSSGSRAVPAPADADRSRVSAAADADLGEEGCEDDDLRYVSGSSAEDDHEAKEFDDDDDAGGGGGGAVPSAASRPVSPPVDGAATAATAVVGAGAGAGSKPPRHGFGKIRTVGEILSLDAVTLMTILDPLLTADECQQLLQRIASRCAPPSATAWSMLVERGQEPSSGQHTEPEFDFRRRPCFAAVPTCLSELDRHLGGGLDRGQLAEICGDSGSGKTQWALTAAAHSALRRLRGTGGGGTLYVDARCRCGPGDAAAAPAAHDARRQSTNVRRLREIAAARLAAEASASKSQPRVSPEGAAGAAPAANDATAEAGLPRPALATISPADVEATVAAVMSNVVALEAANAADGLLECLDQVEEEIVMRNHAAAGEDGGSNPLGSSAPTLPVSLVVVDGMSSLFSEPFPSPPDQQLQQRRAGLLLAAAQQLKRIALQHNVAVLVLNHGTGVGGESSGRRRRGLGPDGVDEEEGEGDGPMEEVAGGGPSYGLPSSTALGTAWHHCVSTRIVVRQSFLGSGIVDADAAPPTRSAAPTEAPAAAEGVASTLLAGERTAVLTKSCTAPCPAGPFPFSITSRGVEGRV